MQVAMTAQQIATLTATGHTADVRAMGLKPAMTPSRVIEKNPDVTFGAAPRVNMARGAEAMERTVNPSAMADNPRKTTVAPKHSAKRLGLFGHIRVAIAEYLLGDALVGIVEEEEVVEAPIVRTKPRTEVYVAPDRVERADHVGGVQPAPAQKPKARVIVLEDETEEVEEASIAVHKARKVKKVAKVAAAKPVVKTKTRGADGRKTDGRGGKPSDAGNKKNTVVVNGTRRKPATTFRMALEYAWKDRVHAAEIEGVSAGYCLSRDEVCIRTGFSHAFASKKAFKNAVVEAFGLDSAAVAVTSTTSDAGNTFYVVTFDAPHDKGYKKLVKEWDA